MANYYGHYQTQIGASVKGILSKPQPDLNFPPVVNYEGNNYRFITSFTASTPNQERRIAEWAKARAIETDIQLNP